MPSNGDQKSPNGGALGCAGKGFLNPTIGGLYGSTVKTQDKGGFQKPWLAVGASIINRIMVRLF